MHRTFNCGIGLALIVGAADAEEILIRLRGLNEDACVIGTVESRKDRGRSVVITER
jgi:phosphoribosylformylglycinamidine cyclo-ligase